MVAINPSYDDSDDAHTEQWTDRALHRAAAEELSVWGAQYAPRKPSAGEIIERLSGLEDGELSREIGVRSLVFAEDGRRVIFKELLGIADLDETVPTTVPSQPAVLLTRVRSVTRTTTRWSKSNRADVIRRA